PFGAEIDKDTPNGVALRQRISDAIYAEQMDREYATDGMIFGYRYEGSPVIWPDGTPEPKHEVMKYEPTARPGHRAPHIWLDPDTSILDLFGPKFVLLRFGEGDTAPLEQAAADVGMPLAVHTIEDEAARALYEQKFVLVRPDGHVAWRADACPEDAKSIIDRVRGAA
ncbi:MAG: 2-polyprenyl-6-methoxyphenol hydroxylase, partial [Proteobacteria bacterium]|nr:2-polyprenyl-6-methoxyphenol hydroxylase [Pseudomonadota bacterium]